MKLIIAPGNFGKEYDNTRHNIGFSVINTFANKYDTAFKQTARFFAYSCECIVDGEKVLLVKPTTFYNDTGRSFAAIKQFYKIDNEDILVIHDELALPFGTLRSRVGGADAGNNGIKSINSNDGSMTNRLRIGISNELRLQMGDTDFVLGRFSKDEQKTLTETLIPKSLEIMDAFVVGNHQVTSHRIE